MELVFQIEYRQGVLWEGYCAGPYKVLRNKIDGEYDITGVENSISYRDAWALFESKKGKWFTPLELRDLLRFGCVIEEAETANEDIEEVLK